MMISAGDGDGEGVVATWLIVGAGSTCLGRVRRMVIPAVRMTEVTITAGNCQPGRTGAGLGVVSTGSDESMEGAIPSFLK